MSLSPLSPPDISFCIVNLNSRDYLNDCLETLAQYTTSLTYEVILVDNASSDGSVEMVRREFPEVTVIENPENAGFTRPMNQALQCARGRYAVQLNPDTRLIEDTFSPLVAYLDSHPEIGICIPKVVNRDLTLQKQCRRSAARPWDTLSYFLGLSRLFPHSKVFSGYLVSYRSEDEIHEVEAVSGSCMVIRQSLFQDIGYLDEQFFAYQEDSDFCFRARQAGWKVYYLPLSRIIHVGGHGGSRSEVYQAIYWWHYSYYRYYRKNLAKDYFFLVNGIIYALMLLKYLTKVVSTYFKKEKYAGTKQP